MHRRNPDVPLLEVKPSILNAFFPLFLKNILVYFVLFLFIYAAYTIVDAFALEFLEQLALADEALNELGVLEVLGKQNFQGALAVGAFLRGQENRGHAALPDLLLDLENRDARGVLHGHVVANTGDVNLPAGKIGGLFFREVLLL